MRLVLLSSESVTFAFGLNLYYRYETLLPPCIYVLRVDACVQAAGIALFLTVNVISFSTLFGLSSELLDLGSMTFAAV